MTITLPALYPHNRQFGMTASLSIAMAQLNQRVGDLKANAQAMLEWRQKAGDVDLILFPEQQLIGYPAEDLVLKPAFQQAAAQEMERLAAATADGGPSLSRHSISITQSICSSSMLNLPRTIGAASSGG